MTRADTTNKICNKRIHSSLAQTCKLWNISYVQSQHLFNLKDKKKKKKVQIVRHAGPERSQHHMALKSTSKVPLIDFRNRLLKQTL
jgi:hypothetical protein